MQEVFQDHTIQSLAELFGILADPTRLRIVTALQSSELAVSQIAITVGMSLSAVSHQLRLLKTMKLVKYRKQGKSVFYSLDDSHIEQLLAVAAEHVEE
jgi:DNA-binding transcriptional ArsR family regulator